VAACITSLLNLLSGDALPGSGPPILEWIAWGSSGRSADPLLAIGLLIGMSLLWIRFRPRSAALRQARELRRLRQTLRRVEERFQGAFNANPIPLAITTLEEGRFVEVNDSFLRLCGCTREGLIDQTAVELRLWASPDERRKAIASLQSGQAVRELEGRIQPRTGGYRDVLWSLEPIELDRQHCLLTVVQDITERKRSEARLRESEERFQLIARATNDTVWDWDLQNNQLWWNEGIHTVFGYTQDEAHPDADWWDQHIHAEDRARVLASMRRVIDQGGRFWSAEYRFARADGTYAEVFDRAYVIHDDAGGAVRMLGAVMDITERKRFLTELGMARDAAVEALRLKSEFLANISHEVRTPLNGIVGMSVLLQDTALNPEQRSYLETIQSSTEALLTIINDILDFSKIEAGKVHFERLDFELRGTVDSTIEILADRAQAKHIELITLIDGDVPDRFRGDPGRLRQVLTNLVVNALKFTEHGEVVVQVSRVSETDTGIIVMFSIRDTGIGIPREALPYLFEAFSQVDGSTTRKHGGTGLGLSISKQLVELMGGQIGVESTAGQGSTFWFTLRLEKPSAPAESAERWPSQFPEARILVAAHHPATCQVLLTAATALGAEACATGTGGEALQCLRLPPAESRPFDLAVIDQQLQDLSGTELAQALQGDPLLRTLPILLLLPRGQTSDTTVLRASGIRAVLTKPLRQRALIDAMARLLGTPASHETRFWLDRPRPRPMGSLAPLLGPARACRILVAEDNPINQRVALALLEKLGYKAQAVATGPEVLRALEAVHYHIILMDCQLPEIDGFEATREIRRQEREILDPARPPSHIIAMTAMAQPGARERCLASGMNDYLSKPVRIEALTEALRKALDGIPIATKLGEPGDDPGPTAPCRLGEAVDPAALEILRELQSSRRPDPLGEMVGLFLRQAPACIREIDLSLTRYEAHSVEKAAHSLKGSASTLGAHQLAEICRQIEDQAQKGSLQVAGHLLNQLRVEYSKVRDELQTLLNLPKG
jgi:two-component system, sensor histidine kinase and response regulator